MVWVRFNTRVDYVGMLNYGFCSNDLKWVVRSIEKKGEKVVEEVFDAVVVATGHYSQPRLPSIKGMDTWKKKQMRSHMYMTPEPFRDDVYDLYCGGGWKFLKWTTYINRACGSSKGSPHEFQISENL